MYSSAYTRTDFPVQSHLAASGRAEEILIDGTLSSAIFAMSWRDHQKKSRRTTYVFICWKLVSYERDDIDSIQVHIRRIEPHSACRKSRKHESTT